MARPSRWSAFNWSCMVRDWPWTDGRIPASYVLLEVRCKDFSGRKVLLIVWRSG